MLHLHACPALPAGQRLRLVAAGHGIHLANHLLRTNPAAFFGVEALIVGSWRTGTGSNATLSLDITA